MLDYAHLEALLTVEREKSFDGAAKVLGITSSAISQRIKLLEERIGAITLNRQPPVSTTDVGAILCRHAERVLLLEQEIIQQDLPASSPSSADFRKIKIAINDDSLSSWFMDALLANSKSDFPFLLEMSIADQDHSVNEMKAGSALAAISIDKAPVQGFQSTFLGTQVYKATASPEFIDRYFKNGVTVDALIEAPTLRYNSMDNLQSQWIEQVFGQKVTTNAHTLPSSSGFVSACLANVAWGMNPTMMVDDHIKSGHLVELLPGQLIRKPLYWHCSRVIEHPLREFTQFVLNSAQRHLDQSPLIKDASVIG